MTLDSIIDRLVQIRDEYANNIFEAHSESITLERKSVERIDIFPNHLTVSYKIRIDG